MGNKKISLIENQLTKPEKVFPKYQKHVTTFDKQTSLDIILKKVKENGHLQFPIYDQKAFLSLITANGIGTWLANHVINEKIDIVNQTAASVLKTDNRRDNYRFVSKDAYIFQVMEILLSDPACEAILITSDGQVNKPLLGIIRPKEIFQSYYEEWSDKE